MPPFPAEASGMTGHHEIGFFDLHCDTAGVCFQARKALGENSLHVSLNAGADLRPWCQTFAVWIPEAWRGAAARAYYEDCTAYLRRALAQNTARAALCADAGQMRRALDAGRCAALLAVENASALNGELASLDAMRRDGVRMITLTWNGVNEAGSGALSGDETGLTAFGKALLREMGRLGIAADVSHLNRAGFWDVMASETPAVASHSNAAAVWPHPRSLEDCQIKALIERKGLMGLCFCRDFLGAGDDTGREAFLRHLTHVLELGGEDILAVGSDFDGAETHPELDGLRSIVPLYEYLSGRGLKPALLDKVFFGNAYRFFLK